MCRRSQGKRNTPRSACRPGGRAWGSTHFGRKGAVYGHLLANHTLGREGTNKKMCGMSGLLPGPRESFSSPDEAEPLVCISGRQVIKFMWKNIVTKFGIPKLLISNNDYSLSKTHSKNGAQRKVSRKGSHQWHTLKRMDRQRCPTERSSMESSSA